VADPDEKRKKDWEAKFGMPYPTAPTPTPVEPLAPVTYEPSPFARPAQTRPPFNQAEWEKKFGPFDSFLPTTPSGVTTAMPTAVPPMPTAAPAMPTAAPAMPTAAPPGAPGQQPKSSFWDFFDPVVDPVVSGFESALGGIKAVPGMVMESLTEEQQARGLGATEFGAGDPLPAAEKFIGEPVAAGIELGVQSAPYTVDELFTLAESGLTLPPGGPAGAYPETAYPADILPLIQGEAGLGETYTSLLETLGDKPLAAQIVQSLVYDPLWPAGAGFGALFNVAGRVSQAATKQRVFAAGIKHFVNEAGLTGAQADDASEIILLLAKKKNMTGATFESEANRIIQGMKDAAAASPPPTARTVPRALPGKVVITREEMLAREAVERPGYVDVGDVDPVAQKLADLNAKAGPGDVKFAYFDPETEEFTITLLKEEVADEAAKAGLGERLLNDNEVFVTSYRAQIKKAAADAASEPVVVASDIPEDALPAAQIVPDDPAEVVREIKATEERVLGLSSQIDYAGEIAPDQRKFIGNTKAQNNRWRNLFYEIDNNQENVLATTMAKFFRGAPKKRTQDIVTWAQNKFPGSFRENPKRRLSTVKFDVLDELASEWNDMYRLGVPKNAEGKVDVEEVLSRIRALWNRIDGVAEFQRQSDINQQRLDLLNSSPAGQQLKEQAETAARQLDADELEALVDNSTDMVRYLRDMVAVEMGERPGFLAEEFLTRFDKTVDDLMELSFDAADSESTNVLLNVQSLDTARLLEGLDSMLADLGTTAQVRLEDLPAEVPAVTQQIAPGSTDPSEIWPAYNKELEAYVQRRFVAEQEFYASFPYTQQVNKINPRRNHLDRLIKVLENRIAAEGGIRMVSANDIRRIGDDLLDEIRSQPVGQERVPSLIDLSTLREVAPPKVGSHRAYHGTISTFDAFRHGASADNSLYGPGVYLTDDPNIATGYAKGSFRIQRQMGGPQHGQPINDAGEIISEQEAYELAQGAPQIWSVDVEMVKFFDIDAVPDPEIMALIRGDEYAWADGFDYANLDLEDIKTNHDLYQVLHGQFGNKWEVNDWLAFRGFDTITHIGGGRTGNLPHRVYIALSDPYVGEEITSVSPRFGPPKAVKVIEALPPAPERPVLPAVPPEAAPVEEAFGDVLRRSRASDRATKFKADMVAVSKHRGVRVVEKSRLILKEAHDRLYDLEDTLGRPLTKPELDELETGVLLDAGEDVAERGAHPWIFEDKVRGGSNLWNPRDRFPYRDLAEAAPEAAPAPAPGITMAPRTAVQTGLEGFDVPGQQAEMIIGGTDVAKPEGLINPEELARRNEVVQQVNDGQMALDEGSLSEVMKANAGQHVDGVLRWDLKAEEGQYIYNGLPLKRGDLLTNGVSLFRIERVEGFTLQLDELDPSGDPRRVVRTISASVDPGDVDRYVDLYRHDSSKPIGGGGSSGWGKNLSDGAGGEKPNKPREMGPDGADPQAPPVPPESKNRIKRLYSSPGNDGGIYLADPRTLQQMVDEGTDADELTQWMFRNIPGLWRMNPSVARQSPVERLVMGLFRSQVADDAYIDVVLTMAYDAHASVWTGKMDLPINWKTGQWTHGKWDEATQGPRPLWYDVWSMRRTDKYKGLLTEEHSRLITDYIFVIDEEIERIRLLFGLAPRQKTRGFNEDYIPRKASTWTEKVAGGERKVEFEKPSNPNMPRLDLTATEIYQRFNVDFLVDPRAVLELHVRQALREIRMKEFNDALEEMGAVVGYKDILAATHPQLIRLRAAKYGEWSASRKAVKAAIRALNGEELQTRIGKIMADITQEHNLDGVLSRLQIEERLEREPIRAELASEIARLKEAERTARDEWYAVRKLYAEAVEKIKKAEKVKLRGDGVHLFGGMLQEGDVAITANQFKNKFMLTADFKSVQEVITYMTPGGADANTLLKLLFEKPANIARTTMSTVDLVLPFTHLLPLFGENPLKWAQAASIHYASWFAPGLQSRLVRQNLNDYWDLATHGVSVGDPEVFAMMTPGQGVNIDAVFKKYQSARPAMGEKEEKLYEYFRNAQHLTRQGMVLTVGRAQSAYQGALGYGRVLLKQAVEESWDGSEDEMYSHIRNMTGALDSRRLGVSANQRAVESMWMGFSPRLLRSTIAVTQSAANWVLKAGTGVVGRNVPVEKVPFVGDVASRALGTGATTQQRRAFLALARLATYMTSIYILTGMRLGKDWEKEIKPGLNPLNGRRFLSYYMNGSYYGVGGQLRALTQFTFSLYGAASGKRGDWHDIHSLNIHKNPFWFFYSSRGALGLTFGGAIAEGLSSEFGVGQLDILPFDNIEGVDGLWDWSKTAWWPFSAQTAVEAGTWTAGLWSGIVGNVTTNPRDRAIAYITRDSAIEQNVWSEAPPYLRALANELVTTGTNFEDVEMKRRKSLIQLNHELKNPNKKRNANEWNTIEDAAGTERRWLSQDIDFGPSDLDSSDPNKKALAEWHALYSDKNFVKDGIVLPDTMGTGWTWLYNAQELLKSTWTREQHLHVLASTNLRPVPYDLVHVYFPNSGKAQLIKASQEARRILLTEAGHPELAVLQENIFYMRPLTESLSPEMAEFIKNMPPKIGFEKSE
jgi:hypothetical protein